MSERIISGSYIIYENNDLRITRGALVGHGEIGDKGSIQEFNEKGERLGYWSCSRMILNNRADNYCSSVQWLYNDKGVITHTESKDVHGNKSRKSHHHQYTYNGKNQLVGVKTEYYSLISTKRLFWNSKNQIYKIIYEDGSPRSHQQSLMTYNSKGLLESDTYRLVQGGQRIGYHTFSYEYYED